MHYQCNGHVVNAFLSPFVQGRSLIKKYCWLDKNVFERQLCAQGSSRVFATGGMGWTLPTVAIQSHNGLYTAFLQSALAWNYTPYFQQNHWFHIDRWDRIFPRNEIALSLQAYGSMRDIIWSCDLTVPYECGDPSLIMPLRRGISNAHFLPLEWSFNVDFDRFSLSLTQEYDVCDRSLVSSYAMLMLTLKKFRFGCGYLFHNHKALLCRELLSTIQHFGLFDISLPLTRNLTMHYDSQLYAEKGTKFLGFKNIKPLLHRIRLEYSGHCWGMYIGYEEKKYRDFGVNKTERALVFSLSLDSIGSFAKKISKTPEVITS